MDWEMYGVSIEPEEVFETLKHCARPLAVIIFGADSALKTDVYKIFRKNLNGGSMAVDRVKIDGFNGQIRATFREGYPVLVCLHGNRSLANNRHSTAQRLKKLGARTLVGVYAKAYRSDVVSFNAIDREDDFDIQDYYRQINSLLNNPPSSEPFHYLITVESSDGDYPAVLPSPTEKD